MTPCQYRGSSASSCPYSHNHDHNWSKCYGRQMAAPWSILKWHRNWRAAEIASSDRSSGLLREAPELHSQASTQTVVSDVSKDDSDVILTLKWNEGTTIRRILLALRHGAASHRIGIFHFSSITSGTRNPNAWIFFFNFKAWHPSRDLIL